MYQLSAAVVNAISTVAKLNVSRMDRRISKTLLDGVKRLSEMFTKGGKGLGTAYLEDQQLRASYLTYYVPVNVGKVQLLLQELRPELPILPDGGFRVLDLGGGPGTGALALLDWCCSQSLPPATSIRMTIVDRSPAVLKQCVQLWRAYIEQSRLHSIPPLQTIVSNLERSLPSVLQMAVGDSGYHLIIVQNLLSELFAKSSDPSGQRTAFVAHLLECLAPDGSLMLIEPALKLTSRGLHEVRNNLLAEFNCSVYSPCLHNQPCPALVRPDDWCHEERQWKAPDWIAQIDSEVGLIKDSLKFSYVILRKDGKTLVPQKADYHRVVSELRVMKGEKRVWLCDVKTGRSELGRLDKEISLSNIAFDDCHRGAIIQVSEIVRKERKGRPAMVGRILSSGAVEVIRPA